MLGTDEVCSPWLCTWAPPSPELGPRDHGDGQDSGLAPKGVGVLEEDPTWPGQ